MTSWPDHPRLRRCALGVAVVNNLDLLPATDGVVLVGESTVAISWSECRQAVAGADPESADARDRLTRWLLLRQAVARHGHDGLAARARPYGAIVESPLHPGMDWVQARVLGDALDLGIGFVDLLPDGGDRVVTLPQLLLRAAGVDATPWWSQARLRLEQLGAVAAERLTRSPREPLRPMGDCDVVTLLGSATLRAALAAGASDGMRTLAVPSRDRGWLDLSRADPAFVVAAASLTDEPDRGFVRPLLVTREELTMARAGGDVVKPVVERSADVVDLREYSRQHQHR